MKHNMTDQMNLSKNTNTSQFSDLSKDFVKKSLESRANKARSISEAYDTLISEVDVLSQEARESLFVLLPTP